MTKTNSKKVAKTVKKKTLTSFKKLREPIPKEFLISYVEDGKTFTSFNPQVAIDRLNEIFGVENWTTESELLIKERNVNDWSVAIDLSIIIKIKEQEVKATGSGGYKSNNIGNAFKGARTSAFKNACRYLGIGRELYVRTPLDDDLKDKKEAIIIENPSKNTTIIEPQKEEKTPIEKQIDACKSLLDLKGLEEKITSIEDTSLRKNVYKIYNNKKLSLMTE